MHRLGSLEYTLDILPPADTNALDRLYGANKLFRSELNPNLRYLPRRRRYRQEIIYLAAAQTRGVVVGASLFSHYRDAEGSTEGSTEGSIDYIARDPNYPARGIGRILVMIAEETLHAHRCTRVNLTSAQSDSAYRFWHALGYLPSSDSPSADFYKTLSTQTIAHPE